MSNFQQKDNSGALFLNDRKEKENQPDYKGKCMVNGREMEMAAWKRQSQSGNTYMSFSFSQPYMPNQSTQGTQQASNGFNQPNQSNGMQNSNGGFNGQNGGVKFGGDGSNTFAADNSQEWDFPNNPNDQF